MKHLRRPNMKKQVSCIIVILVAAMLAGCAAGKTVDTTNSNLDPSPYVAASQNTDVKLSNKESKITADTDEITLVLENKTDIKYLYGELVYLEVESNGI